MKSLARFLADPDACPYLPDQTWRIEFDLVNELTQDEYSNLVQQGWRRFGFELFRPRCLTCNACQPLRVSVEKFHPNRSQRRVIKANDDLRLEVSNPKITREEFVLYMRHHQSRSATVGWDPPTVDSTLAHLHMLGGGPLETQEWSFYLDTNLLAVLYVDPLADGLSTVYSFYDPDYEKRSLGTFMILSLIEHAAQDHLPFVYLGYYIEGCRSMSYKACFKPNQVLGPDGNWHDFA